MARVFFKKKRIEAEIRGEPVCEEEDQERSGGPGTANLPIGIQSKAKPLNYRRPRRFNVEANRKIGDPGRFRR